MPAPGARWGSADRAPEALGTLAGRWNSSASKVLALRESPGASQEHAVTIAVLAYFRSMVPKQIDVALAMAEAGG